MHDINVNVETLTPLTPEIISRQATINIGTIGHVAHGKSTLVRAISGVNVSINYKASSFLLDCPPLQGALQKYHHQARLCQLQAV